MEYTGVMELVSDLRAVQENWRLDTIAASVRVTDGHTLTVRLSGPVAALERDDGEIVLIPKPGGGE
jgi:hypothetical protein